MHLLPLKLTILVAAATLSSGGCRREQAPDGASSTRVAAPRPALEGRRDLCDHRPRCSTTRRQAVAAVAGAELVELEIAHVSDASTDEERCNRREYWLSRPSRSVLLAADCTVQFGADNAGPADVRMSGSRIDLRYVEFQSDDRCELYNATVDLAGPTVVAQNRLVGAVSKNQCIAGQERVPFRPIGDGSQGHPLLTLHRE